VAQDDNVAANPVRRIRLRLGFITSLLSQRSHAESNRFHRFDPYDRHTLVRRLHRIILHFWKMSNEPKKFTAEYAEYTEIEPENE